MNSRDGSGSPDAPGNGHGAADHGERNGGHPGHVQGQSHDLGKEQREARHADGETGQRRGGAR